MRAPLPRKDQPSPLGPYRATTYVSSVRATPDSSPARAVKRGSQRRALPEAAVSGSPGPTSAIRSPPDASSVSGDVSPGSRTVEKLRPDLLQDLDVLRCVEPPVPGTSARSRKAISSLPGADPGRRNADQLGDFAHREHLLALPLVIDSPAGSFEFGREGARVPGIQRPLDQLSDRSVLQVALLRARLGHAFNPLQMPYAILTRYLRSILNTVSDGWQVAPWMSGFTETVWRATTDRPETDGGRHESGRGRDPG